MQTMPDTIPITRIKSDPGGVLDMLKTQPILLTNRGNGAAVLTSTELWNSLIERLKWFERQARADAVEARNDFVSYEHANPS